MRRVWWWLLLMWLAVPALAQNFPVEVKVRPPGLCPGCDCPLDSCFSPACECTLPVTEAWAQGMLERTVVVLQRAFPAQMSERVPVTIHAVSATELGYTGLEQNFGLYGNGVLKISKEISRRQAAATIAHEYGHAWHFSRHPDVEKMTAGLVEGFAEWVAFQALKRMGDFVGTDAIRFNTDPLYGVGFRWFYEVERSQGLNAVFDVALGWLDLVGTRVDRGPEPAAPPTAVAETPPVELVSVPRAATRTGGFWMSAPQPSPSPKGDSEP